MLTLFSQNDPQQSGQTVEQPVEPPMPAETPYQTAKPDPKVLKDEHFRQEAINRLRRVLGTLPSSPAEPGDSSVEESPPESARSADTIPPYTPPGPLPEVEPPKEVAPVTAVPPLIVSSGVPADDARNVAERLTRNLGEALAGAFIEIQRLAAEDLKKFAGALEGTAKVSGDLEALRQQVALVHDRLDLVTEMFAEIDRALKETLVRQQAIESEAESASAGFSELRGRVDKLAERIQVQEQVTVAAESARVKIQDVQQSLQRRLDIQAGVIKMIHSKVQERDDRLVQLLTTLQQADQPAAGAPAAAPLADDL